MRETPADTAQAIVLAIAVHLLLVLVLFAGLWWTRSGAPAAAGAISAEMVDASDLSTAMQRTLRQRPEPIKVEEPLPTPEPEDPEPLPEPVQEQQAKPQDFIPVPDEVDQAEVTEAPTPTPAKEDKVQEAKQRQAQVDLTQEQRQQAAQQQQRLTEMEQQRQKQIEDIRRRRAAAAREAELAEQRLAQLASARSRNAAEAAAQADAAASSTGAGGNDDGLQARYIAAIQAAVLAKWTPPESVVMGSQCRLVIRQLPGGTVMSAEVTSPCALDEAGRRSVEAAVLKAQPLPYAGFEKVFNRQLNFNFRAEKR